MIQLKKISGVVQNCASLVDPKQWFIEIKKLHEYLVENKIISQ